MQNIDELRDLLGSLDGRGYKAYKVVAGRYDVGNFELRVDHVQGDPFADPSRVRAMVPSATADLPPGLLGTETRRTAVADFLNRELVSTLTDASARSGSGSGKSGVLQVLLPGQQVLRRSALHVGADGAVEARFRAGLPARGRRILGREAARLLCEAIPAAVHRALRHSALDAAALRRHVHTVEDARALRDQLDERRLVAFVADGSVLPRRSGVDDRPLTGEGVVPFESPSSLRVTLRAPNAGSVSGMGVTEGVTLLVGGGFHGKSTLLRAIERGVYDHADGDGRERVVTRRDTVKVRAEDGRPVASTDISNFIGTLPGGVDTTRFQTLNASGSTSQAAGIAEALEVGAGCLLLDEDTSATNFLIRDARVQALIARDDEPITPLIDRVRALHREAGVSSILVVGGSGDYFEVADTVIGLREYRPYEATADARRLVEAIPTRRVAEAQVWQPPRPRVPDPETIDARRGRKPAAVRAFSTERLEFGRERIDTSAVTQLVEEAQLRAIGRAMALAREEGIAGGETPVETVVARVMEMLERDGLDRLDRWPLGDMAEFRVHELAAVLNRLRTLRCRR